MNTLEKHNISHLAKKSAILASHSLPLQGLSIIDILNVFKLDKNTEVCIIAMLTTKTPDNANPQV